MNLGCETRVPMIRFPFENRKQSRWCLLHDFGTLNEEIKLTKRKGDLRL